jgi:membrane-bound serine protease (ClpP class)
MPFASGPERREMSGLGIILMLLGVTLLVAEAHVPAHGTLATGAAIALTVGVMLTLSAAGAAVAAVGAAGVTVAVGGFAVAWLLVTKSVAAHRSVVRSGPLALAGRVATVRTVPEPIGRVQLDGALWRARMWDLDDDGAPPAEGSAVIVESIKGLTLTVRPAEDWELY